MSTRRTKLVIASVASACLVVVGSVLAQETAGAKQEKANEKRIAAASLPAAVQKTTREQSKGAAIVDIGREIKDWKTVYEVAMKVNGHTKDIIIGTDGTVLVSEVFVETASLPAVVRETIEKNLGKAKLLEVVSVTEGDSLVCYEARIKNGKKESELKVGLEGRLLPPDPKEEE